MGEELVDQTRHQDGVCGCCRCSSWSTTNRTSNRSIDTHRNPIRKLTINKTMSEGGVHQLRDATCSMHQEQCMKQDCTKDSRASARIVDLSQVSVSSSTTCVKCADRYDMVNLFIPCSHMQSLRMRWNQENCEQSKRRRLQFQGQQDGREKY